MSFGKKNINHFLSGKSPMQQNSIILLHAIQRQISLNEEKIAKAIKIRDQILAEKEQIDVCEKLLHGLLANQALSLKERDVQLASIDEIINKLLVKYNLSEPQSSDIIGSIESQSEVDIEDASVQVAGSDNDSNTNSDHEA